LAWVSGGQEVPALAHRAILHILKFMPIKEKIAYKKQRGRPPGGRYANLVPCRLAADTLVAVDAFAAQESVTRSEAIRRLIEFALADRFKERIQPSIDKRGAVRNRSAVTISANRLLRSNHYTATNFLPIQCRMARMALGLGVRDLAAMAKVSVDTVLRFERGEELKERTIGALMGALEAAGVEFTNGDQPGVRLRKGSPPHRGRPASEPKPSHIGGSNRGGKGR
jgi:hypothetical protein